MAINETSYALMVYVLRTGHDRGPSRLASRPPQAFMSVPPLWHRFPNALTQGQGGPDDTVAIHVRSPAGEHDDPLRRRLAGHGNDNRLRGTARSPPKRRGSAVPPPWTPLPTQARSPPLQACSRSTHGT